MLSLSLFFFFSVPSLPILPLPNAIHTHRTTVTVLCLINCTFILIQFDDTSVPIKMYLCIRCHASINGILYIHT